MLKNITFTLIGLSLLSLSACSDDTPQKSDSLRKIGSPIQGVWQVAESDSCNPDNKTRMITISDKQIELSNETNNTSSILLENMKQPESTRFIIVSGTLNLYDTRNTRTLAYEDEGDKLTFKGFLVNGKLLKRQEILEKYNADGNAKRNVTALDFNYCGH